MTFETLAFECNRIFVDRLRLQARIGIHPWEIQSPQTVLVSIEVWTDRLPSDADISGTVNYVCLADIARQTFRKHIPLVETAVAEILERLKRLPRIKAARVSCQKPHAIPSAESAGVEACFIKDGEV